VDLNFSLHVPVDDLRHIGAAARAAEGSAAPYPAGHELKRPRRNLLAGAGNTDNDALAPATVAALQRRTHELDVAHAFERVVGAADLAGAALGHVHEMGDEIAADFVRIDEVRHAETLAPGLL